MAKLAKCCTDCGRVHGERVYTQLSATQCEQVAMVAVQLQVDNDT